MREKFCSGGARPFMGGGPIFLLKNYVHVTTSQFNMNIMS